ncbi:hypothetical protein CL176_00370 [Suicoccus acidiformans]|uniref:DUF1934 domain-containing protein n=1 Tax=Suicoccus acidiformans TaxID=2036206 RepID=A0A347WHP7_9LACT|nr:DUF1934 domain-containing protein [Suicoccus acidiformans]AXY24604.1 hypothetical protein CL176_00370 [Suicoccus acidiformans]
MERKQVRVIVEQTINYIDQDLQESFKVDIIGEYLSLRSFRKVNYHDNEGLPIEVKWQVHPTAETYLVDIKQPAYDLRFNPVSITQSQYQTPAGLWLLDVETKAIEILEEASKQEINIYYQISLGSETLADYHFRLLLLD